MGRTLHYRVKETLTVKEFERIQEIADRYNSKHRWAYEKIKLWRETSGALWGFTKVNDSARDRKLVIRAIKEISKATPRLTLLLFDEGWLGKGEWATFKDGKQV